MWQSMLATVRVSAHLGRHADGHAQDLACRVQPQLPHLKVRRQHPHLRPASHARGDCPPAADLMLVLVPMTAPASVHNAQTHRMTDKECR